MFLDYLEDAISGLCYYDRKDCNELSVDDVKQLIESGGVTLADMSERIGKVLFQNYKVSHETTVCNLPTLDD